MVNSADRMHLIKKNKYLAEAQDLNLMTIREEFFY